MTALRFSLPLVAVVLAACANTADQPAPVEHRTRPGASQAAAKPARPVNREPDWRPKTHTVVKGDTLYSLALEYGLDYREMAQWNDLADPNVINVGQVLKLFADEQVATVKPLPAKKPLVSGDGSAAPAVVAAPATGGVISWPKALKLPYSDGALAELNRKLQPPAAPVTPVPPVVAVAPVVKPAVPTPDVAVVSPVKTDKPVELKKPQPTPPTPENDAPADDEALEWVFPTQGKLLLGYNEKGNKGWDIGGKKGQAIFSASVGKVVYSGTGLRGYGKLVIIKHNKTYLSAYAHCQTILVKEGDLVTKGQKIAEMGDTDSDTVKLHFEIRRFGRPVDPSKYLPAETKP